MRVVSTGALQAKPLFFDPTLFDIAVVVVALVVVHESIGCVCKALSTLARIIAQLDDAVTYYQREQ